MAYLSGFDLNRNRRRDEMTNDKNVKGKYFLRIMLEDVFGFIQCQEKASYGLGFILTLTKSKDQAVIDRAAGIADARTKIDHIHWYVLHFIQSLSQQKIIMNRILKKTPTEFKYSKPSKSSKSMEF